MPSTYNPYSYGGGSSGYTNPYTRGGYGQAQPQQTSVDPYSQMQRNKRFGAWGGGASGGGYSQAEPWMEAQYGGYPTTQNQGGATRSGGWSPGGVGASSPQRQYGMASQASSGQRWMKDPATGQMRMGSYQNSGPIYPGGQPPAYAGQQQGQAEIPPATPTPSAPGSQGYQWKPGQWDTNAQSRLDYLNGKTYQVTNAEQTERDNLRKMKGGMDSSSEQGQFQQNMNSVLPMLPQLQQYVMSIPSGPFDPSPEERWQTMLKQIMLTGNLKQGLQYGRAWGGS